MVDEVYSFTLTASLNILRASDDFHGDDSLTNVCSEDDQQAEDQLDSAVSLASMMCLVNNMLKLDCSMQETILKALCLKTSSSELEAYCLMWDLRPYIDDNMIQLAWNFVS
uniref:Uncharacterized protein n=1 Tax=Arundo donax TaxID=35708 RepID=A0A0A9DB76_ARUDO